MIKTLKSVRKGKDDDTNIATTTTKTIAKAVTNQTSLKDAIQVSPIAMEEQCENIAEFANAVEKEAENKDDDQIFFTGRVWLAGSGYHSFSSTIVIPKILAKTYKMDRRCHVLMLPLKDGIFIKKLTV